MTFLRHWESGKSPKDGKIMMASHETKRKLLSKMLNDILPTLTWIMFGSRYVPLAIQTMFIWKCLSA